MKRLIEWVAVAIAAGFFAGLFAIVLIEWFAGCGETYVDADGVRHHYECVFIPHNPQ
jgi:hypothetical protein